MFELFFKPQIKETNDYVKVSFISRNRVQSDIQKLFNTSRVNTYMFKHSYGSTLVFQKFFALEFFYILDVIINASKTRSSINHLKAVQNELIQNTWLSLLNKPFPPRINYAKLKNMSFTPLAYQMNFIKKYDYTLPRYNLRGMLLAADPGTGKTFTGLAIAECLEADKVIVICPKPAVGRVWVKSCTGSPQQGCVFNRPQTCWTKESGVEYNNERFAIFHYEALGTALELVNQLQGSNTMIILDESHNLNEISSSRTKKFIELCSNIRTKDILLMTGTPIKALSLELIPMLKSIDPLFNNETLDAFKKMYAGEVQGTTAILTRRYNIVSYKVSKQSVSTGSDTTNSLLEPIHEDIKITIPNGRDYTLSNIAIDMAEYTAKRVNELSQELPEANNFFNDCVELIRKKIQDPSLSRADYNRNKEEFDRYIESLNLVKLAYKKGSLYTVTEEMKYCSNYEKTTILPNLPPDYKEKFIHAKTLVKYLKLKVRGECLGRVLGRKRIDAFRDLINEIPFKRIIDTTQKKTVIFTTYSEVIDAALLKLKRLSYNPIAVYGKFTQNLTAIVTTFEKEQDVNPLVATYASLSTAVPLIMADTMIIVNPPFRQYVMDQTIARIHRLGASTQTRIFNILLDTGEEPNISTRTINIMQWSKDQVSSILGIESADEDNLDKNLEESDELLAYNLEEI
jgi:SNF2 family DNA or RNA helicase